MKESILKKYVVLSTAVASTLALTSAIGADGTGTGESQPSATSDTDRVNNYDTVSGPRWRRNTTTQTTRRTTTSGQAMRPVPSSGETVLDPALEGTSRGTGETINRGGPSTSEIPTNGTGPGTGR